MDNLTHSLTGLVLARAGLGAVDAGRDAARSPLASNLPDIDDRRARAGRRPTSSTTADAQPLGGGRAAAGAGSRLGAAPRSCAARGCPPLARLLAARRRRPRLHGPLDELRHARASRRSTDVVRLGPRVHRGPVADPAAAARRRLRRGPLALGRAIGRASASASCSRYVGARAVLHAQRRSTRPGAACPAARVGAHRGPAVAARPVRAGASWPTPATRYWTGDVSPARRGRRRCSAPESAPRTRAARACREKSEVAAIFLDFSTLPVARGRARRRTGRRSSWRDLRFERRGRSVRARACGGASKAGSEARSSGSGAGRETIGAAIRFRAMRRDDVDETRAQGQGLPGHRQRPRPGRGPGARRGRARARVVINCREQPEAAPRRWRSRSRSAAARRSSAAPTSPTTRGERASWTRPGAFGRVDVLVNTVGGSPGSRSRRRSPRSGAP